MKQLIFSKWTAAWAPDECSCSLIVLSLLRTSGACSYCVTMSNIYNLEPPTKGKVIGMCTGTSHCSNCGNCILHCTAQSHCRGANAFACSAGGVEDYRG